MIVAGTMKDIEDFISAWSALIGAIVGAALIALVVLAAAFSAATHARGVRRVLRHVPLVGRLFQPSVSLGTFDDSAGDGHGPAVVALVGLALRPMSTDGGGVTLDVITGAESFGDTVAKLGDVAPQFKALGAILAFATETAAWPRYQLCGSLEPDAGHGPGLTLALDQKRRAIDGTLLTRRPRGSGDTDVPLAFEMLALVAAGWTEYAVRWADVRNPSDVGRLFDYNAKPRSYAYLRAGAVLEYLGHQEEAIAAYEQSVIEDETNAGALANLGRIRDRNGDPDGEVLLNAALAALHTT